jgi:hypothetical protein
LVKVIRICCFFDGCLDFCGILTENTLGCTFSVSASVRGTNPLGGETFHIVTRSTATGGDFPDSGLEATWGSVDEDDHPIILTPLGQFDMLGSNS